MSERTPTTVALHDAALGRLDTRVSLAPPTSAVNTVVDELQQRILDGSLAIGTLLPPERELATHLHVSRATLRQGLSILAQRGLVTSRRGRNGGIVVTAPSMTTVASTVTLLCQTSVLTAAQLTEVRRGLEVEAAQLAAVRRSDEDVERLNEALSLYVGSEAEVERHNQYGRLFHFAIAEASGNPLLVQMMYSLNQVFADALDLIATVSELRGLVEVIHRPIVEAIVARDAEEARRAMVRHFDHLERALTQHDIAQRQLGHLHETRVTPLTAPS